MGKKCTYNFAGGRTDSSAIENGTAIKSETEISRNPAPLGVADDSVPTLRQALQPICPDPNQGFQPLSDFFVSHITKRLICQLEELSRQRKVSLDLNYWKYVTHLILRVPSTEEAIIVSAPAGSGKSSWITALTLVLTKLIRSDPELYNALVGAVIVLQKVEDLNRLADVLNTDAEKDNPNMVALQGWSVSGQCRGFCQNPAVQHFDECVPATCPKAAVCELRIFREQSMTAPIVGLTQERFNMLRASGDLNRVLYRIDEKGYTRPRRFLIFDEKFLMAQVHTLDKNTIDEASLEMTKLIGKRSVTDSRVKSLQQKLSILIERPFQQLRGDLRITNDYKGFSKKMDIWAGFCKLEKPDVSQVMAYEFFRSFVLEEKPQYASRQLREAIAVIDALHTGEDCLYSKTNGFAISHILPPNLRFGQSQTIIFDATAQIDEDYSRLKSVQFLSGVPKRKSCNVVFHIFTHDDLNVSKSAMQLPWKLQAFSQLISDLSRAEDMFICTYKDCSEALACELEKTMPPDKFQHVLWMENRDQRTLPYLGGTNGSNQFNNATQVFMLGYPRLNPRDYLIRTCAAYGNEQIRKELEAVEPAKLIEKHPNFLWSLPSIQTYMAHHLASRLEQEIYRCKLRNPGFTGTISVFLFHPPDDMMKILLDRISGKIIQHNELPVCVEVCKNAARRYKNDSTSFGRLAVFLSQWDGSELPIQQLRDRLSISPSVWKDLMKNSRVTKLLEQRHVQRKGRGPNTTWSIPSGNGAQI